MHEKKMGIWQTVEVPKKKEKKRKKISAPLVNHWRDSQKNDGNLINGRFAKKEKKKSFCLLSQSLTWFRIIMDAERMVDLTKEKKMGVKGMVEVKNAYENNECWTNGRFDWRKKMAVKQTVEVKNAYENNGCWTNGRFDWRKKDECKTNGRSEKCIWR